MNALRLIPIGRVIDPPPALRSAAALTPDGRLVVGPAEDEPAVVGELRPAGETWFLLPTADGLLLNGARPLPLAVVEPGSLLAVGGETWFVTTEWAPEPQAAPAELAARPCPVCGGELKLAPVVRCACGRYAHLEDPTAPDDPALLNCHLSGPCGVCGRAPSLAAVLVPEPPAQLLDEPAGVAP